MCVWCLVMDNYEWWFWIIGDVFCWLECDYGGFDLGKWFNYCLFVFGRKFVG